ncbi:hypothetical protein Tco_1516472 [Tanacetum coccineum]
MHNNIMAVGLKDRPPMLGPGRYSQWSSRFLWYIDTKPNGEGLRKSILSGPYVPSTILVQAVAATEDDIYSTVDACKTANEMWIAIERLQNRRDKDMQKNLALLAKYFKRFYKPTNNNLRTSSNSRNKTEDTTPRYVRRKWDTVLWTAKIFGHYAKERGSQSVLKGLLYHKEKMMDVANKTEAWCSTASEQADW